MHLSDFEIQIVQSINNNQIRNIQDFYKNNCDYIQDRETIIKATNKFNMSHNVIVLKLPLNEVWNRTRAFLGIIESLEKEGLILIVEVDNLSNISIVLTEDSIDFTKNDLLNNLISKKTKFEIIPLPKLLAFIHNKFQTDEEYFQQEQKSYWKKSLITTFIIAAFSIIISYYLMYTNEREVTIKNFNDTKDTVYIKVIENRNSDTNTDTLQNILIGEEIRDSL